MTSLHSHTCWTSGEEIIKYYLNLSRNFRYYARSLTTAARLAHRQSYRRAYGALYHISHTAQLDLLRLTDMCRQHNVHLFLLVSMQYSLIQRIFIVETYARTKSYEKFRRKFRARFPFENKQVSESTVYTHTHTHTEM